jgi:hypothetical protein
MREGEVSRVCKLLDFGERGKINECDEDRLEPGLHKMLLLALAPILESPQFRHTPSE